MKYLKGTLIAFIVTAAFCTCSVSAAQYSMANVSIPNLKGIATTEKVNKDNFSPQTFDLTACTDSVTGQELGAQVRTYSVNYGGYTDFVTAKKGKKVTISSSKHTNPGTYKLNVRANTSSLFSAKLFGTWVLD